MCGLALTFKYATNIRISSCWNDAPGNGRSLCPHFLGRAFIYLFVHLFTFLGWMLEVILCLKPAGRIVLSDYRLRVDARRRSNQRRDLGAECSRGLPAYVWEVGDQTEGRRKRQRLRVCLHKEDDYRALLSKKCCLAASLKPSNLFIWWFLICCFSDLFHCVKLFSDPGSAGRSMSTTHPVSATTWRCEKGHYESN